MSLLLLVDAQAEPGHLLHSIRDSNLHRNTRSPNRIGFRLEGLALCIYWDIKGDVAKASRL